MAKKKATAKKGTAKKAGKKAAAKRTARKLVKKTVAKKSPAKKVPAAKKPAAKKAPKAKKALKKVPRWRRFVQKTVEVASAVAPLIKVFTGIVSLDNNLITARLDGVLMTMASDCSDQGLIDAHRAFLGKDGHQAAVEGSEGQCDETVIHVARIL
jgi:hypothetical protein